MTTRRDFGRMAGQMREALDQYDREELIDLLTHITRIYVIEGGEAPEVESSGGASLGELGGLSFAQLVLHLQMNLPHEALRRLQVSGGRVWVSEGGNEIELTREAPDESPPDADMIERDARDRVPAQEAFGDRNVRQRAEGERAASGPTRPSEPRGERPVPGTPRSRTQPRSGPGTTAQDAGQVSRPNVGLREPAAPAPRMPPSAAPPRSSGRDWSGDMSGPARPRRQENPPERRKDDAAEEEVGDVSDRFSTLELD